MIYKKIYYKLNHIKFIRKIRKIPDIVNNIQLVFYSLPKEYFQIVVSIFIAMYHEAQ